jgi:uncharacterized protein (UPF0333 family)
MNNVGKKAQVSLEYLILVAAFFSALLIILPTINNISNDFFVVNDSLLIKQVSDKISEQDNLFSFLADGSRKEFVFIPSKKILLKTFENELIISTEKKSITTKLNSKQNNLEKEFNSKFKIILEKENNKTKVFFE